MHHLQGNAITAGRTISSDSDEILCPEWIHMSVLLSQISTV